MADGDLCTSDDVKHEGNVDPAVMTANAENITWHISDESEELLTHVNASLTSSNRDAKKAVVFAVLSWMESEDLIPSSKEPTTLKDGDFQVSFSAENNGRKSYGEQYQLYRAMITPTVIGSDLDIGCGRL
jgi:hypothetical protein